MSRLSGPATSFFADWRTTNSGEPQRRVDMATEERAEVSRARRLRRRRYSALATLAISATAVSLLVPGPAANADPSPQTWYRLRMCESSNNYRTNTGNGHYGAYQFDVSTWRSVGGSGYPNLASPREQDARALILYRMRGWQPWQCAGILGLSEDRDAGSGYTGDISIGSGGTGTGSGTGSGSSGSGSSGSGSSGMPAFPGARSYVYGDNDPNIAIFQNQMHKRGFFPAGTGRYGPMTLTMVEQLQRVNGLTPTGNIGPKTWQLAWLGRYRMPAATVSAPKPPPAPAPRPTPAPTRGVPTFPSTVSYVYGDNDPNIKIFQDQMHKRGLFPTGTGQFGPKTLAMVKRLQQLNGVRASGLLGPKTWRLAWVGRYTASGPARTPTHSTAPARVVPAFPSTVSYVYGDNDPNIKIFQDQMHRRGLFPAGTGQFGPKTLAMVKRLQQLNGVRASGLLGPKTWRLAWVGRFR